MTLAPWMANVKKLDPSVEVKGEGQPTKLLCTQYEKNLKKLPGDLTFVKAGV